MTWDEINEYLKIPLVSMLFGAGITWLVAWWYYKRAGDDLRIEARSLHSATNAIVYMLEHPDTRVEAQRDETGASHWSKGLHNRPH